MNEYKKYLQQANEKSHKIRYRYITYIIYTYQIIKKKTHRTRITYRTRGKNCKNCLFGWLVDWCNNIFATPNRKSFIYIHIHLI